VRELRPAGADRRPVRPALVLALLDSPMTATSLDVRALLDEEL
jgi:hypothetical protein